MEYTTDSTSETSWIRWPHSDTSLKTKIASLEAGTKYWVRVRAIIKGIPGAWSDIISAIATNTFGVPDSPKNVTLTPGDGQITVSWGVPTDNGGSAIVGYDSIVAKGDEAFVRARECDPSDSDTCITGTSTVLTDLDNGVAYAVAVRACNLAGCGQYSAAVEATPSR